MQVSITNKTKNQTFSELKLGDWFETLNHNDIFLKIQPHPYSRDSQVITNAVNLQGTGYSFNPSDTVKFIM